MNISEHFFRNRNLYIIILYIIFAVFLITQTSCCGTKKLVSETTVKIDTTYVNPFIDTLYFEKPVFVQKDSIVFDTLKAENEFTKALVYVDNHRIKVRLESKPFEMKIEGLQTTKTKQVVRDSKHPILKILGYCVMSFLCGMAVSVFLVLKLIEHKIK